MALREPTIMNRVKLIIALLLGAFLTLFFLQNMAQVDLTILFWTFQARRIVVIGLSFVVGFALGWIFKALSGPKADRSTSGGTLD